MDKSKLMMFIIIALLVLLLGTVVGVTFYLIGLVGDDSLTDFQRVEAAELPPSLSLMDLREVPLGDRIVTNLAIGERGTSDTVATGVILGVNNTGDQGELEEFVDAITERVRMARGIAINVFGDLTYEQVRSPEGQQAAAEEIMSRLQAAFSTNLIIHVGFYDWNVQRGR